MEATKDYSPVAVCLIAASLGILFADRLPTCQIVWYSLFGLCFLVWLAFQLCDFRLFASEYRVNRFYASVCKTPLASFAVFGMVFALFGQRYTQQMDIWHEDEQAVFQTGNEAFVIAEAWLTSLPELQKVHSVFQPKSDELVVQTAFNVKLKHLRRNEKWDDSSAHVRVCVPGDHTALQPGDLVKILGKASRIVEPGNPGQFDQRFYMQTQGLVAVIQAESAEGLTLVSPCEKYPVVRLLGKLRSQLKDKFVRWIPEENCPLACAMVLGLRNDLDSEAKDLFRETGTIHILAISGMHIGLVTSILFFVLKMLLIPRRIVCVLAMLFAIGYAAMTGGQPPAVRAALFLCVIFTGIFLGRHVSPINGLAITAMGILLYNPLRLFDVGAHLSFLAVGAFLWIPPVRKKSDSVKEDSAYSWLVTFGETMDSSENRKKYCKDFLMSVWSFTVQLFKFNIFIWAVLAPLILKVSNLVTPIAVLINPILWIPLWFATFLSFLLALCNGYLSFLQPPIGILTGFFYELMVDCIALAHRCPLGFFYVPSPPDWWLIGLYFPLVFWTLFPDTRPSRRTILFFICLWSCVGPGQYYLSKMIAKHKESLEIITFSVGHGNASLASFPDGRNVLYDCGSFSSPHSAGYVISKYILNRGQRHLDLLILSHPDSDHYNTVEFLLEQINVRAVVVPRGMFFKQDENVRRLERVLREKKIPVHEMTQSDSLDLPGFPELTILHPDTSSSLANTRVRERMNSNAMSLVVRLNYLNRKILFTGDLDAKAPAFLNRPPEKIDVLHAPHHGGRSGNTMDLIRWSDPDFILVSEGRFRTNHTLVERIGWDGTRFLNTYRDGAIILTISKGNLKDGQGRLVIQSWRTQTRIENKTRQASTASDAAP
ncbi:MAG: ComEC/Rec2 family competence protein [Thermoguttaceae bacterium]|nr:ComEC/Rec2 family competence protein [Thermoguttaceae bacterium]